MEAAALDGGFSDPAQQAARVFRALLDAMARPGTVRAVAGAAPPRGLSAAAGAALVTLADAETPIWLPERLARGPAADWLRFHTGAPGAGGPGEARFAVGAWGELAPLAQWPAGGPAYPDRSATLIVELDALEGGPQFRLAGPGIAGTRTFAPALPEGAAAELAANAARFPLGVDLILAAGDRLAALPRSTRAGG
jgi:alpha-D-ribose 1-methylphosphonate 5-triphosphate synthase subunit PhnH